MIKFQKKSGTQVKPMPNAIDSRIVSQSIRPLMMNRNRPKVRMTSGQVKIVSSGRTRR